MIRWTEWRHGRVIHRFMPTTETITDHRYKNLEWEADRRGYRFFNPHLGKEAIQERADKIHASTQPNDGKAVDSLKGYGITDPQASDELPEQGRERTG